MALTTDRKPAVKSAPPASPQSMGRLARLHRDWGLLVFAVPGLLVFLIFHYVPLLGNVIAFKDYQPYLGIRQSPWVGFSNFTTLFSDPEVFNALKNTLILTLLQVGFVFPAPIILALVLNSLLYEPIKRVVQSVLYMPHFLSWVIVVAIFQQILGNAGLLNTYLRHKGIEPIEIIGNPDTFRALITSQVIWKDTGWGTILFLAALSRVDQEQYEAAAVDGASPMRQLWHVTLPALRPLIILLGILRLGDSLSVGFEQILLQQGAGTGVSEVLDTYVYHHAFQQGEWGVSAAVGLVKGLVGLALVLGANKVAHLFGEDGVYRTR